MTRSSMKAHNFVVIRLKLVILCSFALVNAETHWLVTEDGKIQALADSLLNMAKPHDFVQFLKQEELVQRIEEARIGLTTHKSLIDYYERKDDPMIEKKLMLSDLDCLTAVKPLVEQDLFVSTQMPPYRNGPEWFIITELLKNVKRVHRDQAKAPSCTAHVDLPFSMASFDHLESVVKRANLSNSRENVSSLLDPSDWSNLSDFGHAIETMLFEEPKSWVLYTLASYFWRIAGSSEQAVECLRRALHFVPRAYAATPMLSLGNVLHQSGRSKDAVAVLETAGAYDEHVSHVYFTLGHAYAVSLQYNKSVQAMDKCLTLDPNYPLAGRHRAAVRCHQKLESTLEAQHQNLQKTVEEMQSYQVRLKGYHELREEAQHQSVDPGSKQDQTLIYDHFRYGPLNGLSCKWTVAIEGRRMDCTITDYPAYKQAKLARTKPATDEKPSKRAPRPSTSSGSSKYSTNSAGQARSDHRSRMVTSPMTPKMKKRSNQNSDMESSAKNFRQIDNNVTTFEGNQQPTKVKTRPLANRYESDQWPDDDQCPKILKHWSSSMNNPPQLFPNLERKGVDPKTLLGTDSSEHPLPWFPPFCAKSADALGAASRLHLSCCDHLLGVQRAKNTDQSQAVPEPDLKPILLSFSASKSQSEAEVGQRIASYMKTCTPENQWIGYNLAALYWRVLGVPSESSTCLRLALSLPHPRQQHPDDPALFQLAQLAYNAGHRLDDAIALLHQALEADPDDAQTHYLIAHYYLLNENYETAAEHLVKCLRLDKNLHNNATLLLKLARCQNRLLTAETLKASSHTESNLDSDHQHHVPARRNQSPALFNFRDVQDVYHDTVENYVIVKFPNTVVFKKGDLSGMRVSDGQTVLDLEYFLNGAADSNLPVIDHEPLLHRASLHHKTIQAELEEQHDRSVNAKSSDDRCSRKSNDKNHRQLYTKPGLSAAAARALRGSSTNERSTTPLYLPMATPRRHVTENGRYVINGDFGAGVKLTEPITTADCARLVARVDPGRVVSTWLSLSSKGGVNIKKYLTPEPPTTNGDDPMEPHCPVNRQPFSMWTMDHLIGFNSRHNYSTYEPEVGLKQGFLNLMTTSSSTNQPGKDAGVENLGSWIAVSLNALNWKSHPQTDDALWVLASAAALYWRVKGRAAEALECLKLSLAAAPLTKKDVPLVSMANVYHQGGYLNSALAAAVAALWISPHLAIVHFNLANIYLSMGAFEHASSFLYSTLAMQPKFDPAKDRLRALKCLFQPMTSSRSMKNRFFTMIRTPAAPSVVKNR